MRPSEGLTIDLFESFLKSQPKGKEVGIAGSPSVCPIANYVQEICFACGDFKLISIFDDHIRYEDPETGDKLEEIPAPWVSWFIRMTDARGGWILAEAALTDLKVVKTLVKELPKL